jgi:hypothetical protein
MTYGSGTKGKGSLAQIFLRPLTLTLDRMFLTVSALLGVAILFLGYWLIRRSPSQPARDTHSLSNSFASTMAWATLAIVLGILAGRTGLDRPGWGRDTVMKGVVYAVFLGTTWQTLRYAVLAIRRPLSKEEQTFWLQYGVSATVAATLALSWPAFEAMVVPGLAVLLCLLFSHSSRIAIAICLFLTYSMTVIKIETPFYWDGLRDEPVRGDMVNMQHPLLRGFRLPRATADLTQHITATIQAHSSKDETIFIYPGLVAFYLLADRRPPTFAYDHTMDIAPDDLCRADARRLLARTPAVILEYIASTETIEQREAVWRAGRISGQRDLIAAIRTLTPTYRFHETYPLPGGGVLHLWAKK